MTTLIELEKEIEDMEKELLFHDDALGEQHLKELEAKRLEFGKCLVGECGLPCLGIACKHFIQTKKENNTGSTGSLKHLDEKDKQDILFEVSFFFSDKGFIDGVALYQRLESVMGCKGEISNEKLVSYLKGRRRR